MSTKKIYLLLINLQSSGKLKWTNKVHCNSVMVASNDGIVVELKSREFLKYFSSVQPKNIGYFRGYKGM